MMIRPRMIVVAPLQARWKRGSLNIYESFKWVKVKIKAGGEICKMAEIQ